METVLGIVALVAIIFVGMWLWEKIQALFFAIGEFIATFPDGSRKRKPRSIKTKSALTAQSSLQHLPEPLEAHDTLEAFCRVMHKLDVAMSPYCQYEGQASLFGGIDNEGNGYAYFWYDKDYAGVDSVFREIGYYSPSGNGDGWFIQNGIVHYKSKSICGYSEWIGYNASSKQFKDAAESSMRKMIEAVVENEWPEARISSYSGQLDAPSGEPICFSVRIRTVISGS